MTCFWRTHTHSRVSSARSYLLNHIVKVRGRPLDDVVERPTDQPGRPLNAVEEAVHGARHLLVDGAQRRLPAAGVVEDGHTTSFEGKV